MEEICLVTALTVSDFIDPDLTADAHANTGAQLGVLTLAALLRHQNYQPAVVNLDDLFFELSMNFEIGRVRACSTIVAVADLQRLFDPITDCEFIIEQVHVIALEK